MANLAAGRVLVYVAKGSMVIAAVEEKIEPGGRLPAIVPLGAQRVAVLLGAIEWADPAAPDDALRLSAELQDVMRNLGGPGPGRLERQADDIERLGLAMMEPLHGVAARIFHKLDLGPNEPLVELVLAGYVADYGPEVWSLRYRVRQEPLRGDYWRTRVLRPQYIQHYPPEKDQPRTLMEIRYPAEGGGASLLELLERNDPRLAAVAASADEQMAELRRHLAEGRSDKSSPEAAVQFLRAALDALTPPDAAHAVARIDEDRGFAWILEPPDPAEAAGEEKREPGAPTLRKPTPPPPR